MAHLSLQYDLLFYILMSINLHHFLKFLAIFSRFYLILHIRTKYIVTSFYTFKEFGDFFLLEIFCLSRE
ncbi:hypothetical protein Avbf_14636, partial [Armadillidium vulgare]